MILRALHAHDRPALAALLARTDHFTAAEVALALELIDETIAEPACGYEFVVATLPDHTVAGYICWGATPITRASYDVYWLVVDETMRRRGIGRALCMAMEQRIWAAGGGNIRLETSGKAHYAATVLFYERVGYHIAARLQDFYAPGDDLVLLYKRLVRAGDTA